MDCQDDWLFSDIHLYCDFPESLKKLNQPRREAAVQRLVEKAFNVQHPMQTNPLRRRISPLRLQIPLLRRQIQQPHRRIQRLRRRILLLRRQIPRFRRRKPQLAAGDSNVLNLMDFSLTLNLANTSTYATMEYPLYMNAPEILGSTPKPGFVTPLVTFARLWDDFNTKPTPYVDGYHHSVSRYHYFVDRYNNLIDGYNDFVAGYYYFVARYHDFVDGSHN
ncbi:unnamed protein product [Darwinula stevensoni]|uniref:Uncharacterized protein n=1 Tax=Darwinula stevensoni TaxID=69355 RepID=A0A7R9AF10_9CRUS|nr:unnamed protein product [Darwinula stevensoni]CAG0902850.1 unnamed protein product [Darwinula stevensoni]